MSAERLRSQRLKTLLVPVLVAVLGYVVFGSSGSEGDVPTDDAPPLTLQLPAVAESAPAAPPWPDVALAEVLAHDPFHEPAPEVIAEVVPEKVPVEVPAGPPVAERVKSVTLTAVFRGPRGMSAIVDGRAVSVGDSLPNGLRVVAIEATGILVEAQ